MRSPTCASRGRRRGAAATVFVCLALAGLPGAALGQSPSLQVTYDRARLSTPDWGSLGGVSASVGWASAVWGLDLELGFSHLTDPGPDRDQWCTLASCTLGPFHEAAQLDVLEAALGHTLLRGPRAEIFLRADLVVVLQGRGLTHIETGEKTTIDQTLDMGLGSSATLRLSPVALGLRPVLRVAYRRIGSSECEADASCYRSRNLSTVGVGLSWMR